MTTTAAHMPKDEHIAALLTARDPEGVRLLLNEYSGELTGFLLKVAGFALFDHEIDEIINTAVLRVWKTYRRDKGPLRSWVYRMTDAARVDWIRSEKRHWKGRVSMEQVTDGPDEPCDSRSPADQLQFMELINRAVEQMPPRERQVFLGDWQAGGRANADELAKELATTKDTIYQVRRRYKQRLRACMEWDAAGVED